MIYKNEQTDKVNLFESQITEIIFNQKGDSITFLIDWTEDDKKIIVRCEYCSNYRFIINSINNNLCTGLLITGFSYKKVERYYVVQFNLGLDMEGIITFNCYGFSFEVPSIPTQNGGNDGLI